MKPAPVGKLPERPDKFDQSPPGNGIPVIEPDTQMVMIVGPVIGAIMLVVICLFCFLFVWK